jgi:hypothetical protein
VQNFILTPQQFGIPNARVRFYCLVRLHALIALLPEHHSDRLSSRQAERSSKALACPDRGFIAETLPSAAASAGARRTIVDYLCEPSEADGDQYLVPSSFLKSLSRGYRFGIPTPSPLLGTWML